MFLNRHPWDDNPLLSCISFGFWNSKLVIQNFKIQNDFFGDIVIPVILL